MKTGFSKKGFVIVLVIPVIAVLVLVAWVLIDIGCGEAMQVRIKNDMGSAYYAAAAGGERMYARLRSMWAANQTVTWPMSISATNIQVAGNTVCSYSATACLTGESGVFCIISNGTVNGRTATITAKYGYSSNYTNGVPIGSIGGMTFTGHQGWFGMKFRVTADGPVESAGPIIPNGNSDPTYAPNNRYVQYSGQVTQNNPSLAAPSFWLHQRFDTTGAFQTAGVTIPHTNPDFITRDEAIAQEAITPGALAAFDANNVYKNSTQDLNRLDDKDGFFYYYTDYLDKPANNRTGADLGIAPGEANYKTPAGGPGGTLLYGPFNVPSGTNVVLVDGDVTIIFNAQQYWNNSSDLTIISMGDIVIAQPMNGTDDRLTLISYGDVATGGINLGDKADVDGNLVMFSCGNFNAVLGGVTNGSVFAKGSVNVDTEYDILGIPIYSSRDLNMGTDSWTDPADRPIGLPPNYPVVSQNFAIKAENLGTNPALNYNPRWQRR